jgi:staphylococcal nuclease domain-containing protein 1
MASGTATVKAVPSGDTVVLVGKAVNGPPPEIMLTMASLLAPKLARGPQQADDEFAWSSREFLRRLVIGKTVTFKVVQTIRLNSGSRTFGDVYFEGENIAELVVRNGWASVKDCRDGIMSEAFGKLLTLEQASKDSGAGIWSENPSENPRFPLLRPMSWSPSQEEINEIYSKHKGVPIDVVVELVRDGATIRCLVLNSWTMMSFCIAGIICPRVNSSASSGNGTSPGPEPFAMQAKHFTESRLLNRDIKVVMQGIDKNGNIFCTVLHPRGNIAVEMLRVGLAKIADRSLPFIGKDALGFRQAEIQARTSSKFIWANHSLASSIAPVRCFEGVCTEIISGDTIMVVELPPRQIFAPLAIALNQAAYKEIKLSLMSIRVPRLGSSRAGSPDEPWSREAKEFMTSKLLGCRVYVTVECNRDERDYALIQYNDVVNPSLKRNIAEELCSAGLASVTKVPKAVPEMQRIHSAEYDRLLLAETGALVSLKGLHGSISSNGVSKRLISDLVSDPKESKQFFSENVNSSNQIFLKGQVEYAFSGSRFKIYIPAKMCTFQLNLSEAKSPLVGKPSQNGAAARSSEKLGDEARLYSKLVLVQRTIDIQITDCDKNGVFSGRLSVPSSAKGQPENYAKTLVALGLAKLDRYALERDNSSEDFDNFMALEKEAKLSQKGLWAFADIESDVVNTDVNASDPSTTFVDSVEKIKSGKRILASVTEVKDGSTFSAQLLCYSDDDRSSTTSCPDLIEVNKMMANFAKSGDEGGVKDLKSFKKGQTALALFDDGSGPAWFRSKIEGFTGEKADVYYIDYGNRGSVPVESLREVSESFFSIPPQIFECTLAMIKTHTTTDKFGSDAAQKLTELTCGKELEINIMGTQIDGVVYGNEKSSERENRLKGKSMSKFSFLCEVYNGDMDEDIGLKSEVETKKEKSFFIENQSEAFPALPSITGDTPPIPMWTEEKKPIPTLNEQVPAEKRERRISVNEQLVKIGLAQTSKSLARKSRLLKSMPGAEILLKRLELYEKMALDNHLNMWMYGDCGDSEEEKM